jgi:hypothetical protein
VGAKWKSEVEIRSRKSKLDMETGSGIRKGRQEVKPGNWSGNESGKMKRSWEAERIVRSGKRSQGWKGK